MANDEKDNERVGFGIAGFVLSLLGLLLFWAYGFGQIMSILGIVFSAIQLRNHKTGLAIAGLIMGILGIVILIILIILVGVLLVSVVPKFI